MAENRQPPRGGSDINARALAKAGIVFLLGMIAVSFLVWFIFNSFVHREAVKGPPPSQGLDVDARKLPPEPRLQPAPILDLERMRAAEDEIMNNYAWLDQSHQRARIPVSRAMDLVAREGLPARTTAPPVASDATVPTESGLGPIMTRVGGPLSPGRALPPDQPLEIHGSGSPRDGRAAGGPPTPPEQSLDQFASPPQQESKK